MTVKAIGEYDFPPADPPENYGGDLIFYGYNQGNRFFATLNTFRAPGNTSWGAFRAQMLDPWLSVDPDIDLTALNNWRVDDKKITPNGDDTLTGLGIGWKSIVRFSCGSGAASSDAVSSESSPDARPRKAKATHRGSSESGMDP
jgi:hypothetical protein